MHLPRWGSDCTTARGSSKCLASRSLVGRPRRRRRARMQAGDAAI
jgi:hypothetical protein